MEESGIGFGVVALIIGPIIALQSEKMATEMAQLGTLGVGAVVTLMGILALIMSLSQS
jgi:hypothetical protein